MSNSLQPHELHPTRLLCPWNSSGKNTGVGSHSLTPGDLSDSGIEFGSPALQANSLQSEPLGFFKHLQLTQNSARNWQDIHLCPNTLILPVTVLVRQS